MTLDNDHRLLHLVPPAFLSEIVSAIREAYRQTESDLLDFPDPEAADLRGVLRRAAVEQRFARAVVAAGGECLAERNRQSTSSFRLGRFHNVRLTVHKVDHVGSVPRPAEFRGQLAWDGQFDLFQEGEPAEPPTQNIYLVVAHGPHPTTHASPGFVLLAQPDARFESYRSQVELLGRYGDEGATMDDLVAEESISPEISIRVRKSAAQASE